MLGFLLENEREHTFLVRELRLGPTSYCVASPLASVQCPKVCCRQICEVPSLHHHGMGAGSESTFVQGEEIVRTLCSHYGSDAEDEGVFGSNGVHGGFDSLWGPLSRLDRRG